MPPHDEDVQALVRRIRNSSSPREQEAAISALHGMGEAAPDSQRSQRCQPILEAAPELVACVDSGNAFTQEPAVLLLANLAF